MKQISIFLFIFTISAIQLSGQAIADKKGKLEIDESTVVHSLKSQYLSYYRNAEKISGWRLLLYSTSNRREIDKQVKKFKRNYKDIPYEWNYESPYYKLKAGAYHTRLEARNAIKNFEEDFSIAIEIQDKIKKEDFLE